MPETGHCRATCGVDVFFPGRVTNDNARATYGKRVIVAHMTMKDVGHDCHLCLCSPPPIQSTIKRGPTGIIRGMAWRIGIDIGGTFTDIALVEEARGSIGIAKVPTTPKNLAEGVLGALQTAMRRCAIPATEVNLLSHATTVVTNAILAESGARAALITTRGFRDVLELRRSARADLYDLFQDAPAVLIPRRRRFEITERIGADGAVVTPLAEDEIAGLIAWLKEARVEAVAVSLLFSFLNPRHEQHLGKRLRSALPGVPVYLSCEVLPEIKEFERSSTTAVCAYVGPILASYLRRLEASTQS